MYYPSFHVLYKLSWFSNFNQKVRIYAEFCVPFEYTSQKVLVECTILGFGWWWCRDTEEVAPCEK